MLLSSFHPYVAPEVIGCPSPLIDQALRVVAAEFCRSTLAWSEISDPTPLVDGQADYEPDLPIDAQLVTVRDVWCGSRQLQPISQSQTINQGTATAPSFYNMAANRLAVTVFPTPASPTESLVFRACFAPTLTAETLPDLFSQGALDALSSGTKARLMQMPGVPWSNPQLGLYYRQIFDNGVISAIADEAHDRVPGALFVAPRRFGF